MPVFVLGAAFGRMIGEGMSYTSTGGLVENNLVRPGIYAVVGEWYC